MSGEAQVEALLEIISTAARQAVAEYKRGDNEVPTVHSTTFHPKDFGTDNVALNKIVNVLRGSCQQLCASLMPPQHTVGSFSVPFEWASMHVVVRAKVADALERYPNGLHVNELAKKVNLEAGKLTRVLRLLSSRGCFVEVEQNVFANNRVSLVTLASSNTGALSRMWTEDISQGAVVLYDSMTEPEYATSYLPGRSPLIYALKRKGFDGGYFDFLKQDNDKRERFHRAMTGIVMGSLCVLDYYPWNEVKTVCDVGSGVGSISRPLAKQFPHLKLINQDLPEALVQAKDIWAKDAPEALKNNQVEFVSLNFLEESPVQGQDVYFLRNIIHDWPDAEVAIILGNVRKAMAPHSRLLLHGTVLTTANRDPNAETFGLGNTPEPLLPHFGNRGYQQDFIMWLLHNSKERTLSEQISLGSAAGLCLNKVYDLAESALLEFRVAA